MNSILTKTAISVFMAVAVVLIAVPPSMAQTSQPETFKRVEQLEPDLSKGEVSVTVEYFGDDIFKRSTAYVNGDVVTIEFLPDGKSKKAELIENADGVKTIRLFNSTSSGLLRETIIEREGVAEITEFRPDGKTVWYKQFISDKGRRSQYFDKTGRLKLERAFDSAGQMKVDVFNDAGSVEYTQVWVLRGRAYILDQVLEPLENGSSRKIIVERGRPDRCEFLDDEGSLIRSEMNGNFSEPVDRMRLRELDPRDDKTIPGLRLPNQGMRRP